MELHRSAVMEEHGRVSSSSVNFFGNFSLLSLYSVIFLVIWGYVCMC